MAGILDRLVYEIGYDVDKTSFNEAKNGIEEIGKSFLKIGTMATAGASALFGFTSLISNESAEILRLSNAMGVSADTTEAFGNEMKKIGGNAENFLDLVEEMNNKIGEMKGLGEFTAVEESMQILGLRFEDIQKLSPEKQFEAIATASLNMADAQKAVTATDMLMGGEANKLIASLRAQGLTYADVINKQKELTFETDATRQNMLQFADANNDLMRVLGSMVKFFVGTLAPTFKKITDEFIAWSIANKEFIASGIKEFVSILSALFNGLWTVLRTLGNAIAWVINLFGGLNNVMQLIIGAGVVMGLFKVAQMIALIGIMAKKSGGLLALFSGILGGIGKATVIGVVLLILQDIYKYVTGADSVMGDLIETIASFKPKVMEGLKAIGNAFLWLGDIVLKGLLMPFNLVITAINQFIKVARNAGKLVGFDVGLSQIKTIAPSDFGINLGSGSTQGGTTTNTTSNAVTNNNAITVNASGDANQIAQAVGVELNKITEQAVVAQQPKQK